MKEKYPVVSDAEWALLDKSELVDDVFAVVFDNRKCFRIIKVAKTAQRNYVTKDLSEITLPVLLIWGREENITSPAVAEEFKRMLLNAGLIYLPECGHVPMMETPVDFNKLIEDFLA